MQETLRARIAALHSSAHGTRRPRFFLRRHAGAALRRTSAAVGIAAAVLLTVGCEDEDDGLLPGAGDLRLLVATLGPDALELFDAQTLEEAFDSPQSLSGSPGEARAAPDTAVFVTTLSDDPSRAYDSRVFEQIPDSDMSAALRVDFDTRNDRIYLAGSSLAFFGARDFSPLAFPTIDLDGEASDVVYDSLTGRVFVAVTTAAGPRLRVFDDRDLREVPPSPLEFGGAGGTTGDLLLVRRDDGSTELYLLLPATSELAAIDPATLGELPRTPIELRVPAASLTRDPQRELLYAASTDGRLEAVGATDFSLRGGFPRRVASSAADLTYDPETQRLFVADSLDQEVIALDGVTLDEEPGSPIHVEGSPVSVEILDLR